MGSVIKENTEGEPSTVLTETGKGGLLSKGYLREAPAAAYLGDGETAVFVLTDGDSGVERERGGERTTISPGSGYRAITVVTDRRVLVLVGDGEDGGDKRVSLPHVEIVDVRAEADALVVETSTGVIWRCHGDAAGVEDVAAYGSAASTAWRDVEGALDRVKRSIVSATASRDEGAYDEALDAIEAARDGVVDAKQRAARFESEWSGTAMGHRIESLWDRCLTTAAEIHVGHARSLVDAGEGRWREGDYERAHDAFDAARESYETVRTMAPRHRRVVEDVDEAIERLDRRVERLDDAPLRRAIDADRRAADHEPGHEALDALAEARERYDTVLELDPDADERRFAGDRDRIREQREDVTDRYVATAREVGSDALAAGEWYCGSGQLTLAVEELERAVTFLDYGLSVAADERPAVAEELRSDLARARQLLADAREEPDEHRSTEAVADAPDQGDLTGSTREDDAGDADRDDQPEPETVSEMGAGDQATPEREDGDRTDDGEDDAPIGSIDDDEDDAPIGSTDDGGVDTSIGSTDDTEDDARAEPPADGTHGEPADVPARSHADVEAGLRDLTAPQFDRVVTAVVEAMGWRPEPTASTAVDYLARRDDAAGTLAIVTFPDEDGEPMAPETIRESATLATSVPGVDDVMIVTTRPLPGPTMAAAREQDVRVLDVEYLASALSGPNAADVDAVVPTTDT